uniref:RING-type domain-containing protein n=1 Tax=Daphnia galeata TaxID=27404 RepID=A0A8J2RMC1_9CRUS|nr:unnamed protein product [Daphnia galeata]
MAGDVELVARKRWILELVEVKALNINCGERYGVRIFESKSSIPMEEDESEDEEDLLNFGLNEGDDLDYEVEEPLPSQQPSSVVSNEPSDLMTPAPISPVSYIVVNVGAAKDVRLIILPGGGNLIQPTEQDVTLSCNSLTLTPDAGPNGDSLKMSAAEGSTNENDYLLSCGVCFGKYDLLLNQPKILPCSHTFFNIAAVIGHDSTLKCPMCRQTAVGVEEAESLHNNAHAEHNILLNKKLEQAEANSKISSKLLDTYFKSKKSECQVFSITDDHEPKDARFRFYETFMKIPDSVKPAKLRVISCQGVIEVH